MIARLASLGLLASTLAVAAPTLAHAYLAPEQVFTGIEVPPSARETEDIVKDRQKQTARDREAIHNALPSTEDEPVTQEQPVLQPAAPENPDMEIPSLLDDEGKWDRRQERLNQNNNGGTTIIINGGNGGYEPVVRDRYTGEVLHSGAPRMTGTGPAEFVAAAVMFIAATGTFLWARKRERGIRLLLR